MLLLMFFGMSVAFSMALVGFLGMWNISNINAAFYILGLTPYQAASNFLFCIIPLFLLMGALARTGGLTSDLYNAAYKWIGRLPGGLAMGSIAGCAGFAAVSGDSLSTAAAMGKVALPEMKKYNYDHCCPNWSSIFKSAADFIRVFDIYLVFQEQVSFHRVMLNSVQHLTKQGHLRP